MSLDPTVFLGRLDDDYSTSIREGLAFLGVENRVKAGDTGFVKPNLTYPGFRQGVVTNPRCIEELIRALKDYSVKVIVGDSDGGGYNRFSMDEVFEKTGLAAMAKRYGVTLVNLSRLSSRSIRVECGSRELVVPLPEVLLDEVDLFITVPVPKVHSNTIISVSIKNQWGCIQNPSLRLKLHPYFQEVIRAVNKALRVALAVVDGKYGLNRNGPLRGDPEPLNWVMAADNIAVADLLCARLMEIDGLAIRYLRFYCEKEGITTLDRVRFNQDYHPFVGPRFDLKREFWDYPGYFAFRSPFLAYLAYHSPLSRILHKALYLFREKFYDHE